MPKGRPEAPMLGVELELFEALERIKAGIPTHPDLIKKARQGQLKINASTVAKEAGRARTLIGHNKCRYPRIRTFVKESELPAQECSTFEELNRLYRIDKQEMIKTIQLAMTRVADMVKWVDEVERAAKKQVGKTRREAQAEADYVVGASLFAKDEGNKANVLKFPDSRHSSEDGEK